jgi:hypothetical protein
VPRAARVVCIADLADGTAAASTSFVNDIPSLMQSISVGGCLSTSASLPCYRTLSQLLREESHSGLLPGSGVGQGAQGAGEVPNADDPLMF